MALDYAMETMFRACETLAQGDSDLQTRLQAAWTADVQRIWHRQCLTDDLAQRFRALWERYTQKTDDPRTTILRVLSADELREAAGAVIAFARDIALAHGGGAEPGNYWKAAAS